MRTILLFTVAFCLSFSLSAQDSGNKYQKRFQIKSGHVEYKLSGTITGTKILWWDDFGDKYREETNSEQIVKVNRKNEVVKTNTIMLFDGNYYYDIDLMTHKGTKTHKDAVPDFSALASGMSDKEMESLGKNILGALGGRVDKKSETLLGRTCDVTKVMGATVHSYNGVTLRSHAKILSVETLEEAVKFDENIAVAASLFIPPAGVDIEDISEQVRGAFNED